MKLITLALVIAALAFAVALPTTTQQIPAPDGTPVRVNVYIPPQPAASTCRLVHGNGKVILLVMSTGITRTVNSLFVATTMAECQAEVTALKLAPLPAKARSAGK